MSSNSSGKEMIQFVLPRLKTAAINGLFAKAAQQAFQLKDDDPRLQDLINALSLGSWRLAPAIERLDGQTMAGLLGAYTASDLNGQERIYLNADWLQSADANAIEAVLLEEIGHSLDNHFNQGQDSQGDEGAIFSAYLQNRSIPESTYQENDQRIVIINGQKLNIEAATITSPIATASFTDGVGGFNLINGARSITTTTINGRDYAIIPAFVDDSIQIVEITDLANPSPVSAIQDGGAYTELERARHSAITHFNGRTYALIVAYGDDGIQIVDITDPTNPTPAGTIQDGENGGAAGNYKLNGAYFISTTTAGGKTYAMVSSTFDDSLEIINITDPTSPSLTKSVTVLDFPRGFTTVEIGGTTYALIASKNANGLQIINITDPENPSIISSITDGVGGFNELLGANMVSTALIGGRTYALVAARSDDGVQIIDISNPADPTPISDFDQDDLDSQGGTFNLLSDIRYISTVEINNKHYALTAAYGSDGVSFIDISDPSDPLAVFKVKDGDLDSQGNQFNELSGPYFIEPYTQNGNIYALVASRTDDGVQIIQLSQRPPSPTPTPTPKPPPRLIAPTVGSIAEVDNSTTTTSTGLSGNLSVSSSYDPNNPHVLIFSIDGGTVTGSTSARAGSYGSLSLNTSTGTYTYSPDSAAIEALAAGEEQADSFTISVTDNSLSDTATYSVNISGANDAPTLKAPTDGSISEDSNASSFSSSALSGTLSAADIDGDRLTYAISGGTLNGTTATKAGNYGSLSLNSTSGLYTYTPDSITIGALKGGETATDSFTLSVSDGIVSTNTTYTVNLIGADDQTIAQNNRPQSSCNPSSFESKLNGEWILGSICNDIIKGGAIDERMRGRGGHDQIKGLSGSDILRGGSGQDTIHGGRGKDILRGGRGNDILRGGSGQDSIHGGKGSDILRGGADADHFRLSSGKDTIADYKPLRGDLIISRPLFSISLRQQGDDLLLLDSNNNLRTTLLNTTVDDLLSHQSKLI